MSTKTIRTVVVVGGTGVFGRRLAAHLCDLRHGFEGIQLVVTSRQFQRAEALAKRLDNSSVRVRAARFNHGPGIDSTTDLAALNPWAVIDCSGPFQAHNYSLAKAAIACGAHWIDLADARRYLLGFEIALDRDARRAGVAALAGASSTPALSGATLAALTASWVMRNDVNIAIAPGGQSEVGRAVVAAVLSYAGRPVPIWRKGRRSAVYGWCRLQRAAFPGLGERVVSPVETADAELFGPLFRLDGGLRFWAGLESGFERWGLALLARLRRWLEAGGISVDLAKLAALLAWSRRLTRFRTSDRGGMVVEVSGLDPAGLPTTARWSLVAENDDGPSVPIMAAAAALRALISDTVPSGASLAFQQLSLHDIEHEMAGYDIRTQVEYCAGYGLPAEDERPVGETDQLGREDEQDAAAGPDALIAAE